MWLMAETRYAAVARIQMRVLMRRAGQRVPPSVVVAHLLTIRPVRGSSAKLLDPLVLVRRDRLRRQLAADPVGLFG
jgi:hypothetical protein